MDNKSLYISHSEYRNVVAHSPAFSLLENASRSDRSQALLSQSPAPSSHTLLRKSAFSLAEVLTVLIMMTLVAFFAAKIALSGNQKQFDTAFAKTASIINRNIKSNKKVANELSVYENYIEISSKLEDIFISNMNAQKCDYKDNIISLTNKNYCWAKKIDNLNHDILESMKNGDYNFYRLKNGAVIAIQNDNKGSKIFIDVNGLKGPNEFEKDVLEYKY